MADDPPAPPSVIVPEYHRRCAASLGDVPFAYAFRLGDDTTPLHTDQAARCMARATAAGWRWNPRTFTFRRPSGLWWTYRKGVVWRWAVLAVAVVVGVGVWLSGHGWVVLLVLAVLGALPVVLDAMRQAPPP